MNLVYNWLLIAQFASAALTFVSLYFLSAPYGRHSRGGWGPSMNAKLGWMIMESPAVLIIFACFFAGNSSAVLIALLFIWQLHYVQRTFIFPFLLRGGKDMPVAIMLMSLGFNTMNGSINGYFLFFLSNYDISWLSDPRFIIGVLIFLTGWVINIHSDQVLRNLRKPGETAYKIPDGGLHKFVASPNYFGEILEWTGWAILTWSLPGLAFMLFTIANLVPRAHAHRKWYLEKFTDYPKDRKRVIPFVY